MNRNLTGSSAGKSGGGGKNMAQASSSAQREPSMEEILASIRKIIEDSETVAPEESASAKPDVEHTDLADSDATGGGDTSISATPVAEPEEATLQSLSETASPVADEIEDEDVETGETVEPNSLREYVARASPDDDSVRPAESITTETADEVETFREELGGEQSAVEAEISDGDSSMNALSLADIHDEVSRQSDTEVAEDTNDSKRESDLSVEDETPVEDEASDSEPWVEVTAADYSSAAVEDAKTVDPDPADVDSLAELAASIASGAEEFGDARETETPAAVAVEEVAHAAAIARHSSDDTDTTNPPILSERAGRQVAAAFDELSEAFSHNKKFDEMAAEMMRPMLQDWLDNNLPTLVEKLVREEIDRVARGASR